MSIVAMFSDSAFVYTCVIRLFCIALFLTALEFLVIIKQFGTGGIYEWKMIQFSVYTPFRKLKLDFIFNKPGVFIILFIRLLCSICLFIDPISQATVYLLAIVVITSLLLTIRISIGNDGSDQMSVIIAISLFISFLFHDPKIEAISLYFIATQSILSYVMAGLAKMLAKKWRSGVAIFQIMNTESYGSEPIANYLHGASPVIAKNMAWNVMLFEALFFTVVILPYPYFLIFFIWGLLFHFYNAVIMGLNNFFWVFLATYPAIVYANIALHHYWAT
jgi:hypothetical protein